MVVEAGYPRHNDDVGLLPLHLVNRHRVGKAQRVRCILEREQDPRTYRAENVSLDMTRPGVNAGDRSNVPVEDAQVIVVLDHHDSVAFTKNLGADANFSRTRSLRVQFFPHLRIQIGDPDGSSMSGGHDLEIDAPKMKSLGNFEHLFQDGVFIPKGREPEVLRRVIRNFRHFPRVDGVCGHDNAGRVLLPVDFPKCDGGEHRGSDKVRKHVARTYGRKLGRVADEHQPRFLRGARQDAVEQMLVHHRRLVHNDYVRGVRVICPSPLFTGPIRPFGS